MQFNWEQRQQAAAPGHRGKALNLVFSGDAKQCFKAKAKIRQGTHYTAMGGDLLEFVHAANVIKCFFPLLIFNDNDNAEAQSVACAPTEIYVREHEFLLEGTTRCRMITTKSEVRSADIWYLLVHLFFFNFLFIFSIA